MATLDTRTIYSKILARSAELTDLASATALFAWDQETKMPAKGVDGRSKVLSTLAGLQHERLTAPALQDDVQTLLSDRHTLSDEERAQIRELRRLQARAAKVPGALVMRLAEIQSQGTAQWAAARAAKDFSAFAPILKEIVDLKREVAEAIGYQEHPYEALLDEYEPGARVSEVTSILNEVRAFLVPLVREVMAAKRPADGILAGPYDHAAQDTFGREVVAAMGFDLEAGRLDISNHPFTSGIHGGDVRLTTRYKDDLSVGLFGTIHEAGHGLYEQNLPTPLFRTPLGTACSLGVHESQSRLWENQVGRGRPFWVHFYPRAQALFSQRLSGVSLDTFYRAINCVEPSFIRIEADEMTYNLHIVLRYELELDLVAGKLAVKDLPEAWNAKSREYLGLTPPTPDLGVLQDIHWSSGLIGYFPTYTLGNLYAAQLYEAARRDMPDLEKRFEKGDFLSLKGWLVDKVHRWGRLLDGPELIAQATGERPSADAYRRYIRGKFGPLYGFGG